MTIPEDNKRELYAYIFGIIKKMNCHLLRMNGIPNHLHMLVDIHPSVSVSHFVQTVKQFSSRWAKESGLFPYFTGWGDGYYAFSVGADGIDACVQYIKGQVIHHSNNDLMTEMQHISNKYGVQWHENDWK